MNIRTVLGKNPNEPLCNSCSKGLGLQLLDKIGVTFAMQTCCVCRSDQPCCAIRDFAMPASDAPARRQPHAAPDDYSELEMLLGGPRT